MSEEDKIQKFFRTYFTEVKIKQDFAEKILKQAEQYESKNRCREFLGRFFDTLKKSYDPKNPKSFVVSCKRFLFIINKLLADVKKDRSGKYNQILSQQIVQYYLFFFEIIFKNSLHELTVDLKMYRMKWVKLITDAAFIKLRQEILKKYKFNLDRGFSEENLEKIKKIHQKRGLTQKQSNLYLGIQKKQDLRQEPKREQSKARYQNSSQSSSQESDNQNGNKKIKGEENIQTQPDHSYYSGYGMHPVYNPTGPTPFQNPSYAPHNDPRIMRSHNGYSQNIPSIAQSFYMNKETFGQNNQQISGFSYALPQQPNPIIQPTYYTYSFPKPYESTPTPIMTESRKVEPQRSNFNLYKIRIMREQLQKSLIKCRQCGQFFLTCQSHQKHMTNHFFQSLQKVNQAQLKGKIKKQSKIKLLDIKSWQSSEKHNGGEYRFEVLVAEHPGEKGERQICYFCNEDLEVSFSIKYEDWVYSDAIKIENEGRINIIHFQCYECLRSQQNSPAETGLT